MNNDVVMIQLDRPRRIKFGHTALKTLEELTGRKVSDFDQNGLDLTDLDFVEKISYCGLMKDAKDNGESLSIEKTAELLDEAPSFAHVVEKIITAWYAAFGAQMDAAEGNRQPVKEPANVKNSTGKKASA